MKIAPLPDNENHRLEVLRKYGILDTEPEVVFDSIVDLASHICNVPIAVISLIDENRQWFKSSVGLEVKETSRDVSFCSHTILEEEMLVVPDARLDDRFSDNPLVLSDPSIAFYAGVKLTTDEGVCLGTLCVIDKIPRELSSEQLTALKTLAKNIMAHIELKYSHRMACEYIKGLKISSKIFESASEAIMVTDSNNNIITVNNAFTELTGYSLKEVIGKNPRILSSSRQSSVFYDDMWDSLKKTGRWVGELWNTKKNGEDYIEWLSINVIAYEDGSPDLHVAIFSDITYKKRAEELMWQQANYDFLTQLPNRNLFQDRLTQVFKVADRNKQSVAVFFIDLDYFKEVNDKYGHDVGDLLLQEVALRFKGCLRKVDTIARLGGDEFTVILSPVFESTPLEMIVNKFIVQAAMPFNIKGNIINISASIGVSTYPQDGISVEDIMNNADQAMYRSKRAGRNRFSFYVDHFGL